MNGDAKINQHSWLYITLIGFVLFVVFFICILIWGKQINLTTPVYFFLIVLIALFATAFLGGAMRSAAKFNTSFDNKNLMITGPAVIFFAILYMGFRYKPEKTELPKRPLALSVVVTGPGQVNELIRSGSIGLRVGETNIVKKINEEGLAYFSGIDVHYKGKAIELFPVVDGYHLDSSQHYFLSNVEDVTNLTVSLKKNENRITVKGKVIYINTQKGIAGTQISFEGVDTTYSSDEFGNFYAILPFKSGSEIRVIISNGSSIIYNSLRTVSDKSFLLFPVNE